MKKGAIDLINLKLFYGAQLELIKVQKKAIETKIAEANAELENFKNSGNDNELRVLMGIIMGYKSVLELLEILNIETTTNYESDKTKLNTKH